MKASQNNTEVTVNHTITTQTDTPTVATVSDEPSVELPPCSGDEQRVS